MRPDAPPSADDPQALFDAVVAAFAGRPDISFGRVMASHGLKTQGRLFAFLRKDKLVLKLSAQRVAAVVLTEGATHFDRGDGRPMREWAAVPPAPVDVWIGLAHEAERFVSTFNSGKRRR